MRDGEQHWTTRHRCVSARYKRDIRDMGSSSEALMKLRPVTFRYKDDPSQQRQYGLMAEEVARVYPDLVSRDAYGKIVSVHYHELVPMLLNEVQKQAEQIQQVTERNEQQAVYNRRLSAEVAHLKGMLERAMAVQSDTQRLAAAFNR